MITPTIYTCVGFAVATYGCWPVNVAVTASSFDEAFAAAVVKARAAFPKAEIVIDSVALTPADETAHGGGFAVLFGAEGSV